MPNNWYFIRLILFFLYLFPLLLVYLLRPQYCNMWLHFIDNWSSTVWILLKQIMLKLVMPVSVKSDWNHPNILISQLNSQLQLDFQSCLIAIENSIDHSKILMGNSISNCQVSMLCQIGLAVIAFFSNFVNYSQYRWQITYLCGTATSYKKVSL